MWPEKIGSGVGWLFRHAAAEARIRRASELEIVSDPHAEGCYARMGACWTGDHESELEGRPRVVPIYTLSLTGSPVRRAARRVAGEHHGTSPSPTAGVSRPPPSPRSPHVISYKIIRLRVCK